jgi:hypothetical protein
MDNGTGDGGVPQWHQLQHQLLRQRSDQLIGPPTDPDEHPTIHVTITQHPLPDGGITLTLDHASDLADVHDLCTRIARACLDNDHHVTFTRTAPEHTDRTENRP